VREEEEEKRRRKKKKKRNITYNPSCPEPAELHSETVQSVKKAN
jgi:hypothetical protein